LAEYSDLDSLNSEKIKILMEMVGCNSEKFEFSDELVALFVGKVAILKADLINYVFTLKEALTCLDL
jgi:hypothetical protein